MGKLILTLPDGSTRTISLEKERLIIGRRADSDLCLPFPAVSAAHAAVITVLDDSFLEDLRSTNGTLVNGKSISKHFLREGDEIDIGRQKLVYTVEGLAKESASAAKQAAAIATRFQGVDPEQTAPLRPMVPTPIHLATIDTANMPVKAAPEPKKLVPASGSAPAEPGTPPKPAGPSLELLSGPEMGRIVPISGDEFVLGRVGQQLAAIRRTQDGYRLVHLEGESTPRINGAQLPGEGARLAVGDEIELAGTRIAFRPER